MDDKAAWRVCTRLWALDYLGGKCIVCGSVDDLQWDHIDSSTKTAEISVGIRDGWSRSRLLLELDKCQLLCVLHHQAKTKADGDHGGGHNKILNPKHGTAVMYGRGNNCRCALCKQWKRDYRSGVVDSLGSMQ